MLIAFDLLLVVVLGLLLYSVSARDPERPPASSMCSRSCCWSARCWPTRSALWAIAARISEFGFSPNRVAALGENVILLVNLGWSAVLYAALPARARPVRAPGTLADGLPAGLRRVGRDRRDRLPAAVRVYLITCRPSGGGGKTG